MSDFDKISDAVDLAIKTANYNRRNNILSVNDSSNLRRMSNELKQKINELELEKARLDACFYGDNGENNEIFS